MSRLPCPSVGLLKVVALLVAWLVWPITVPVWGDGVGVGLGVGCGVGVECAVGDGCVVCVDPVPGALAILDCTCFTLCMKCAKLMPPTPSTPAVAVPTTISLTRRLRSA